MTGAEVLGEKKLLELVPTEPLELPNNLKLTPTRLKLNLTIFPTAPQTQPNHLDEFKLKQALVRFFSSSFKKISFSHRPINVLDEDIDIDVVKKNTKDDVKRRKRGDPVGQGSLVLRDLALPLGSVESYERFVEFRKGVVEMVDELDVNIEGKEFRLSVCVPKGDDIDGMRKDWEEFYALRNRGYSRSGPREPDTIILRGVPSRWFAEPRVSSKPSLLVTHTIFSTFGKIRHLDVAEDDDPGNADDDTEGLIKGLNCKITVQFEEHKDFCYALKAFCSRSLQKQGTKLKVDYEITWDKHGFFRNSSILTQDRGSRIQSAEVQRRSDDLRNQLNSSRYSPDNVRRKRFKE